MIKKIVAAAIVVAGLAGGLLIFRIAGAGRFGAQVLIVNQSGSDVPINASQVMPLQTLVESHSAPKNGGRCDLDFLFTSGELPCEIVIMTASDKVIGRYRITKAQDVTFHLTIPGQAEGVSKSAK